MASTTKHNTMTVGELVLHLRKMISTNAIAANAPVYVSSDEEGNAFGTIRPPSSFGVDTENLMASQLVLYPYQRVTL